MSKEKDALNPHGNLIFFFCTYPIFKESFKVYWIILNSFLKNIKKFKFKQIFFISNFMTHKSICLLLLICFIKFLFRNQNIKNWSYKRNHQISPHEYRSEKKFDLQHVWARGESQSFKLLVSLVNWKKSFNAYT